MKHLTIRVHAANIIINKLINQQFYSCPIVLWLEHGASNGKVMGLIPGDALRFKCIV